MEGSVRRVGDRVRITVQLIEAANDAHMWSNNFDRELDDIFAVQDEVASQVAEALKVKFKGDAANQPTRNIAAYELFLEARELGSRVNRDDMALSIRKFREAIVIRPGVRRCLAWYGLQPSSGRSLEFRFAGPDRGCPRCRCDRTATRHGLLAIEPRDGSLFLRLRRGEMGQVRTLLSAGA